MRHKHHKGFTLLETLVAVAILMLVLGGAFGLIPRGINGAKFSKNQTIASHLAEEAMEIVRNIRDNNMIHKPNTSNPLNWLSGLLGCDEDNLCTADAITNTVYPCDRQDCPPVAFYEDSQEGKVYGNGEFFELQAGAVDTRFTRELYIRIVPNTLTGPATEARVYVRVHWKEGLLDKNVRLTSSLFDWWTFTK